MPLYEFVCGKCHAEFETLVRGEEKPHCPKCDSRDLKKLLSVSATPSISSGTLPTMGCGKPQCGMGGCGGK